MNDYFDEQEVDELEEIVLLAREIGDEDAELAALEKIDSIINNVRSKLPASSGDVPVMGSVSPNQAAKAPQPVQQQQSQPDQGFMQNAFNNLRGAAEYGKDVLQTGAAVASGIPATIAGTVAPPVESALRAIQGKPTKDLVDLQEDYMQAFSYQPERQGAQQMLGGIAETLEPLSSLPPVLAAGAPQIAQAVAARSMSPALPQEIPKDMQQALDINRGVVNTDLAPLMTTAEKPMTVASDPVAKRAIGLGIPEGFVDAAKKMSTADKKKIGSSLDVIDRALDDPSGYGKDFLPSDIIGDSLAQRIDYVKDVNKKAGAEVGKQSKALVGKPIDYEPVFGNAVARIEDDLRVTLDENGVPNFNRSAIMGLPNDEKLVAQVVGRMRNAKTAIDLHDLKKYIQDNVSYGKQMQGGIRPQTENLMKDFARDINGLLAENFPEYGAANKTYSRTVEVLGDMQKRAGNIDIYNDSASALGSKLRMTLSNAPGREPLKQAIQGIDDVAKEYGAKFDDDLKTQINMVDDLEKIFKVAAPKGFEGGITRAGETVQSIRQKGAVETIVDATIEPLVKPFRKSEKQRKKEAVQAIRELLERK
jgi:hypothetical protein